MATYTIKSGDTLNKMAVVYKTTYTIPESVNLAEALRCGIYCVASCVSVGGLIQAVPGSFGGSGGFRTNRSGWAA